MLEFPAKEASMAGRQSSGVRSPRSSTGRSEQLSEADGVRGQNRPVSLNRNEFFRSDIYVETKIIGGRQGAAQPQARRRAKRGAKTAPARRRFVISTAPTGTGQAGGTQRKSQVHAASIQAAAKIAGQRPAAARALPPVQSTVDLTETIKTLLHLAPGARLRHLRRHQ